MLPLNAYVKIAILDSAGDPLPGYSMTDSDPIAATDSLRHHARWNGNTDVSALAGQVVQLDFEIENSKIYALQFVP